MLELYWDVERQTRRDPRGGTGVGVKRLDHASLFSSDVGADREFAQRTLGYRLLDRVLDERGLESGAWLTTSIAPLELVYVADLPRRRRGCITSRFLGRHARGSALRAADVFADHGATIEVPPAQHGIGSSFFLYAYEPGGNRIEVTTGADFVYDPVPRDADMDRGRPGAGRRLGHSVPRQLADVRDACVRGRRVIR